MVKKLSILFLVLCPFVFQAGKTLAYDEQTTHPALTAEIADFAGATAEEKAWLMEGSINEDISPRWVNHFFDPVNNISWTGDNTGIVPASVASMLTSIGILGTAGRLTARDWVNNQEMQQKYSLYGGDRTWKRALEYWVEGNKKEAYITLGHVLHLVEDVSVPDHTRNDPHAHYLAGATGDYGSPYEVYLEKYTPNNIEQKLHIVENLKKENAPSPSLPTIEEYITSLATYSNKYFFSKDTITTEYEFPKIAWNDGYFGYGMDENGKEFALAKIKKVEVNKFDFIETYLIEVGDENILDSYFSRLARQAVLHGAGVLELFKKQAEDAVVNSEFPQHLVAIDPNVAKLLNIPTFSLVGETVKAYNATKEFIGTIIVTAEGTIASIGDYLSSIFTNDKNPNSSGPVISTSTPIVIVKAPPPKPPQAPPPPAPRPLPPPARATTTPEHNVTSSFPALASAQASSGPPIVLGVSDGVFLPGGGGGMVGQPPSPPPEPPPPPPPPPPPIPTLIFTADPTVIELGSTTTLTWSTTDADSCAASGDWSGNKATSSSEAVTPIATGTTTYALECAGAGGSASSSVAVEVSIPILISQLIAEQTSIPSFYQDSWYELGTGYAGTLQSLTLRGYVNVAPFYASHVSLGEYKDATYTSPIQTFTISDNAPFTEAVATTTLEGLSISLKPYFYYRLNTVNDYQNRSVVLFGTNTTGTAMTTTCCPRVEHTYTFMPYMVGTGLRNVSATPPPLTTPSNISFAFNELTLDLSVSWNPSTDPDWPANPLTYEFNYSTSTVSTSSPQETLDPNGWRNIGAGTGYAFSVETGNTYLVGVRAKDNFGAVSAETTGTWNFPEGFVPYVVSSWVGGMSQDFVLGAGGTLSSISVFPNNFTTTSRDPAANSCNLNLYDRESGSAVLITASDNGFDGFHCTGERVFSFAGTAPLIEAGHHYRWAFYPSTGNISTHAEITFYGTSLDTAGGACMDGTPGGMCGSGTIANAKFILTGTAGTVFGN